MNIHKEVYIVYIVLFSTSKFPFGDIVYLIRKFGSEVQEPKQKIHESGSTVDLSQQENRQTERSKEIIYSLNRRKKMNEGK